MNVDRWYRYGRRPDYLEEVIDTNRGHNSTQHDERGIGWEELHPIAGVVRVLRTKKRNGPGRTNYLWFLGTFDKCDFSAHEVVVEGTWDDCFAVFEFACKAGGP